MAANHLPGALAGAGVASIVSGGAQLGGTTLLSIAGAGPWVGSRFMPQLCRR
jgi:hypothetical protein